MTHLVTPKLGELIRNGGTLLMETPLFLLQVPTLSYPEILLIFSFFINSKILFINMNI